MNDGLIPRRYAKALYKFALEKGADKGLYRVMGTLGQSFADNQQLGELIANPFVGDDRKIALLNTAAGLGSAPAAPAKPSSTPSSTPSTSSKPAAKANAEVDQKASSTSVKSSSTPAGISDADEAKVSEVINDFLKLLRTNKRLDMAGAIARAYCDCYRRENHIYRVKVISAAKLDSADEQRLQKMILSHLGGAKMEYSSGVDPDLIGGFTVDIDNERLDASVKNELKQLRLQLLKKS